jgi:hypothetical protein
MSIGLLQKPLELRLVSPTSRDKRSGDGGLARLSEIQRCKEQGYRLILATR